MKTACPDCGSTFTVPEAFQGRQGRCPNCKRVFTVESSVNLEDLASLAEGPKIDQASSNSEPGLYGIAEPTKRCPFCGQNILEAARKCKHCRMTLEKPDCLASSDPIDEDGRSGPLPRTGGRYCYKCGAHIHPNQAMCARCGAGLRTQSAGKSRITAGVLAIILGAFGAHEFYLGNTGSAVIRLVVTLLGSFLCVPSCAMYIIALIEAIGYFTMSDEAFEETYVRGKKEWF